MERISLVETELWSDVFMPTKPCLSDINNDATVLFLQWLRVSGIRIFKNNKVTKRGNFDHILSKFRHFLGRSKYTFCHDPEYEKILEDKSKLSTESKVMIVYGSSGSGKTQLVCLEFSFKTIFIFLGALLCWSHWF